MNTILVVLCALGMGWEVFSKHHSGKEVPTPVVSVLPIWLVADTADMVQPTTMARDSLTVGLTCPPGKYQVLCACPGYPGQNKEVLFISRPTEDGVSDTIWQVAFPPNDSLLVVVNNDSTLFTGFSAFAAR